MRGQKGGPARLAQSKISSQLATVEAARCSWGCRKNRRMGSVRHQDLIMHRVCIVVYQPTVNLIIVIVNIVLFDYQFQENKSYGSKKPFTFIL
jgi:hypothetical protein